MGVVGHLLKSMKKKENTNGRGAKFCVHAKTLIRSGR